MLSNGSFPNIMQNIIIPIDQTSDWYASYSSPDNDSGLENAKLPIDPVTRDDDASLNLVDAL
jgi:hypothetical protein